MKKIQYIFNLLGILIASLLLSGCEFYPALPQLPKLETPVIVLEDNVVSWNDIENAEGYIVNFPNSSKQLEKNITSITLTESTTVKIKAVGDNINYQDSNWSNIISYNSPISLTIGQMIEKEYYGLINGTTTEHSIWKFTGIVVDMSATYFNTNYNNYCVKMILDIEGTYIGIYNGFVNGAYPLNIDGLRVGTEVNVEGTINEYSTLESGSYFSNIQFKNPNIDWEYNNNNDNNKTGTSVNFFMINDTHGAFTDSSQGYSIGRVDTLVDELESQDGDYILIHNGDAFQGSYISGEMYGLPLIEAFNTIGFDCFVLGNHEFDWGLDKIAAYADGNASNGEANFPFLGANIYYKGTTTRPEWIDPYTIVEYNDLKVGIIGVIGDSQESSILTKHVKDYEFVNPINIIKEHASTLRVQENCDVVVVATHDYNEYLNQQIANLSGNSVIDSIFCAHTHQLISEYVIRDDFKSIPVVQNHHKNNTAQAVRLNYDEEKKYVDYSVETTYPSRYAISDEINTLIGKYSNLIDEANSSLGTTSYYISKSTLGSYATSIMLDWDYSEYDFDDIDVSIINTGGIRATIDSGDITRADVFEVFPFNNMVVLVNISGKLIKSLYNNNADYLYIDVDDSIGSYYNLKDNTIYQLAVIDYVFEGTYYTEFNNLSPNDYIETDIILRDELIYYIDLLY